MTFLDDEWIIHHISFTNWVRRKIKKNKISCYSFILSFFLFNFSQESFPIHILKVLQRDPTRAKHQDDSQIHARKRNRIRSFLPKQHFFSNPFSTYCTDSDKMAFISTPVTVSRGSVSRVTLKSSSVSWKVCVSRHSQARLPQTNPECRLLDRGFRMQVEVGSEIPTFELPTNGGGTMTNEDLSKGTYILYFYPRDNTPGCTVEAKDFKDYMVSLEPFNVKVVGASRDSVESHDQFVAEYGLTFPLISDDGTLSEAFGVSKVSPPFFLSYHSPSVLSHSSHF